MELFLYRGEWGLPTIDQECARILAYLKFADAKITLNFNGNPFSSPNGMLPYLVTEEGAKIGGYSKIVEYLQSKGWDANAQLENLNYMAINGPIQYVMENLHPYFMYSMWGDPKNLDTTRTLYAKRIPIPFNFYCPRKYVQKTEQLMLTLADFALDDSVEFHDVKDILVNAKKCINWISEKLGESIFFLGDAPCEIDTILYGYLSVIAKLTLPNGILQNHVKQCENLVKYVDRISKTYFAREGFTSAKESGDGQNGYSSSNGSNGKNGEQPKTHYDGTQREDDTPYDRKKRYVVSGLFATVAMVGYALLSGILTISRNEYGGMNFITHDDDADDYNDED
ncbi:metaxin-1 homolog [Uranotaenia lowii]|uniref:metaxin-1 homolog n=1 Tax=Uranotaenia lowii TaxID=190385 RepID=UPI002479DB4A|nr:metaxin-1 homolog [Uranotaenia lowii]XP_055608666.1 metaxin-1 homolog [Uranotaenia lowii]